MSGGIDSAVVILSPANGGAKGSPDGPRGFWRIASSVALGILLAMTPALSLTTQASQKFTRTQMMMGDIEVRITVLAPRGQRPASRRPAVWGAMDRAFQEGRRLEAEVSEWREGSETSKLNREGSGYPMKVGPALFPLLKLAQQIAQETQGAFDITFGSKSTHVSYRDIHLDPTSREVRFRRKGIQLGLSGIAKGFIVDRMIESMASDGFRDALVAAGGDIRAMGGEGGWEVFLEGPARQPVLSLSKDRSANCHLWLRDKAVSTSGRAARGNHLIDPRTGRPVIGEYSATVVAGTNALADGWATAAYVLGIEGMRPLMVRHPELSVVFVTSEGQVVSLGRKVVACH